MKTETEIKEEIRYCEEQQSRYLYLFDVGDISEVERDTLLQLYYERICELDPSRKES